MKVLVTGANGFVGQALVRELSTRGHRVTATSPTGDPVPGAARNVSLVDLSGSTDFSRALEDGPDGVIHLAARAHVLKEDHPDPLSLYRQINTEATITLARAAAAQGVRRFVFVSSIGVHGVVPGQAIREDSPIDPEEPYAVSKWEAEQALREIARESDLEVCIIRPPLVYGPGVRANFLRLIKLAGSGYPLPLGSVRNRRSFIGLHNLCDLLAHCLEHPAAPGATFVVRDGEDLSTPELIARLAELMGSRTRCLPFPTPLLRLGGAVLGKGREVERLLGSLTVDDSRIRHDLGWKPPLTLDQSLRQMVEER